MSLLYDSLQRKKVGLDEYIGKDRRLGMYVCGPTVYDIAHIGHARSAFTFDLIRRYLTHQGYHVTFVRNVTDVDDKIIERARKEGGDLKTATWAISEKYLSLYHAEMKQLGLEPPTVEPRATEYIPQMQRMIQEILSQGAAYRAGGDIYFSVRSAKHYGRLSKRNPEEMLEGTRGEPAENKRDPLDFALWKSAKPEEPSWKSPWGEGRPGWHIECSTMSTEIFQKGNVPFVIHGGGLDLIFPHHENEIAQAEGAGRSFATLWVHNGLVTVNGQKMSKSLGNFITLRELFEKASPEVIRFYFLQTHYRSPLDFSWEKLEGAKGAYERFSNIFAGVKRYGSEERRQKIRNEIYAQLERQSEVDAEIKFIPEKFGHFHKMMDDDLNTPHAIADLFILLGLANDVLNDTDSNDEKKIRRFYKVVFYIKQLGRILNLFETEKVESLTTDVAELIKKREEARENKDFETADKIRKKLLDEGIILMDTAGGVIWRRKE